MYFQDQGGGNHCYGCGPGNSAGLQIKSRWDDKRIAVCDFTPGDEHCAATTRFMNGGVIATIIDCHCVCTAMADANEAAGRDMGAQDSIWFATGELSLSYRRPVPLPGSVRLRAWITERDERKTVLACELHAAGKLCVDATLTAVRVPATWMAG